MCMLLPSGETRNYISVQKERSRFDYKSGPHTYKEKKRITTETVTTTSMVKKTTPGPSPVSKEALSTEQIQADDTLASSSDSDSL